MSLQSCLTGSGLSDLEITRMLNRSKELQDKEKLSSTQADRKVLDEYGSELLNRQNRLREQAGLTITKPTPRQSLEEIEAKYEADRKAVEDKYVPEAAPVPAPALTALGEHVNNPEVYKAITAALGEAAVLKALRDYKADYNAHEKNKDTHVDYEKHLLGLMEMLRSKLDKGDTNVKGYVKQLQQIQDDLYNFLDQEDSPMRGQLGDINITGDKPTSYENLISRIASYEEDVLVFAFKSGDNAYGRYKVHGDITQLYKEVSADIAAGKFDYGRVPATWTEDLLKRMTEAKAARNVMAQLSSSKSLSDIYTALKYVITGEQMQDKPTPSDKQLISVMDMILHAYNRNVNPITSYDPMIYLDGRIGAGKTIMMRILLNTLSSLEGGTKVPNMTLLAGDSRGAGLNLENAMEINQSGGIGNSIQDVVGHLLASTTLMPHGSIRFIVIDEAARGYRDMPLLADALKRYNEKGNDVRVFLTGDNTQVTGSVSSNDRISAIPNMRIATPLTTSFRSKVSSINAMQGEFKSAGISDPRTKPYTFTANTDAPWDPREVALKGGVLLGVSGSESGLTAMQKMQRALEVMKTRIGATMNGKPLTKVVIVNRGSLDPKIKNEDDPKVIEWTNILRQAGLDKEFQVLTYYNAQGGTYDEVYVDLDVDKNDELMNFEDRVNTAIYTAARARNFVYLINNNITTKVDPDIKERFDSVSQILKTGADKQMQKVDATAAHLNKITPAAATAPAAKTTAKVTAADQASQEEPEEEVPPGGSPEDGVHNPDSNGPVPVTPPPARPPVTGFSGAGHILNGNYIFQTASGNIGISLRYPSGGAIQTHNNIAVDTNDNPVIDPKRQQTATELVPAAGDRVAIVPMEVKSKGDPVKYGVFRYTGHEETYQMLGVLGSGESHGAAKEVQDLMQHIPDFKKFDDQMQDYNNTTDNPNYFGMRQLDNESLAPGSDIRNNFYTFEQIPSAKEGGFSISKLPAGLTGSLYSFNPVQYKYDPQVESPLYNPSAPDEGLEWISAETLDKGKVTGTSPVTGPAATSILRIWYNDMYRDDPHPPPFKDIAEGRKATVEIVTMDDPRMREVSGRKQGQYNPDTDMPVDIGGTYLRIRFGEGLKPQFIKLQGARLNNSEDFNLHRDMYLQPLRDFTAAADKLQDEVNKFVLEDMQEDPEAFKEMWSTNQYTRTDSEGNKLTFHRDDPTGFNISSLIFSFLTKRLINMDWQNTHQNRVKLGGPVKEGQHDNRVDKIADFFDRFFAALKNDKNDDERLSQLARELRRTQKFETFAKKGGRLTKAERVKLEEQGLTDERENEMVTYHSTKQEPKIDLTTGKQHGDEDTYVTTYLAQVALQNLAQANGNLTDPVTGRKHAIIEFIPQISKGEQTSKEDEKGKKTTIRSAYDLLRSTFYTARTSPKEGEAAPETAYLTMAHGIYTKLGRTPMHLDIYQLKNLLNYIINTGEYKLTEGQDYKTVEEIYPAMQAGNTDAFNDLYGLMEHALTNYDTRKLDTKQLTNLFGEDAFDEKGEHKTAARVNLPLWLSKEKMGTLGVRWESPAQTGSSNLLKKATPQERIRQMLTTNFTGVDSSHIAVELNSPANGTLIQPSEPDLKESVPFTDPAQAATAQFTPEGKTIAEEEEIPTTEESTAKVPVTAAQPGGENRNNLEEDFEENKPIQLKPEDISDDEAYGDAFFSGIPAGKQYEGEERSKYFRRFVPGITAEQVRFLNRVQVLEETGKDVWGRVKDGAVLFQTTSDNTVYANVIKHEAFHTIFRYFTGATQRDRILNAAIQHYGLPYSDPLKVEEFLAQQFDKSADIGFIPSIIRSFFNWLRNLFGLINRHQYEIQEYFNRINRGAFSTLTDEPLKGEAFMTRFDKDWNSDYDLYKRAWGKFSMDFQKFDTLGRNIKKEIAPGVVQETNVPLGEDEIVNHIYNVYNKYSRDLNALAGKGYDALSDVQRKNMGIQSPEDFTTMQTIFGKFSDMRIYRDMIEAHYRNRFKFPKLEQESDETKVDEEWANQQQNNETDYQEDHPVNLEEKVNVDERAAENMGLNAEIKKENDIDPRRSLTDIVKMFLQTITDAHGVPVTKEFSLFTLYNTIHNIPLNGSDNVQKSKDILLRQLRESFEQNMKVEPVPPTPIVQDAKKQIDGIMRSFHNTTEEKARKDKMRAAMTQLQVIEKEYKSIANKQYNPNAKFPMLKSARDVQIVYDTLKEQTEKSYDPDKQRDQDIIVQSNLRKVLRMTEDMVREEFTGHPFTQAVYDSLKQLIAAVYTPDYVVPGSAVRDFKGDRAFLSDDIFIYKNHDIRRDGKTTEQFMNAIEEFVKDRNRNLPDIKRNSMDQYDIAAVWNRRKAYNRLADIMSIVNNSYMTSPYRIGIEDSGEEFKWVVQLIANDNIGERYGQLIKSNLENQLTTGGNDNETIWNPRAMEKSAAILGEYDSRTIKNAPVAKQEELISTFLNELNIIRPNAKYSKSKREKAAEGIADVIARTRDKIKSSSNPEDVDVNKDIFGDSKGYLRAITAPLVDADSDRNLTTYRNGEGNTVSGIRNMSYANGVLQNLQRLQSSPRGDIAEVLKRDAPYLFKPVAMKDNQVAFFMINPINPVGLFPNRRIILGGQRLFDSQVSVDWNDREWVTTYRRESRKDILSRLFNGNYLAALNQTNIFDSRAHVFTIQPFYIISDKLRSEGMDMEVLPSSGKKSDEHIGQLLFQIVNRPNPNYIAKDGTTPYKTATYNPNYSPFDKSTLNEDQISGLRKEWEDAVQQQLRNDPKQISQVFDKFMADRDVQRHIKAIRDEFNRESDSITRYIINTVNHNSTYQKDEKSGQIAQKIRMDIGFRVPNKSSLTQAYQRLLTQGLISKEDILSKSDGKVQVDAEGKVSLADYRGNRYSVRIEEGHLRPIIENFAFNHFMRGYYLNQMAMGDNSMIGSDVKIVKRMGIAHGGGNSYFNISNELRNNDRMKFIAVDDVTIYRNKDKNITDSNYDHTLYHQPIEKNLPADKLEDIISKLSGLSRLTTPQYNNLLEAFTQLSNEPSADKVALTNRFNSLPLEETIVTDSSGWITERGHNRLRIVGGPGANTQDIMKPLVMGRDEYGVEHNAKFAVEALTDRLVAKFPAYLDMRIQADFGSLNDDPAGMDTPKRRRYQRAVELETERIKLLHNSADYNDPDLLSAEDEWELNDIYDDPRNKPAHFIVPPSAMKYNAPAVSARFDYLTNRYVMDNHAASSFSLSMQDIRIQQNPVNDPKNSTVGVFTQLMYMSNVNGENKEESENLFHTYSELQRISAEGMNEEFPMQDHEFATRQQMAENMNSAVQLMIMKNEHNPSKIRELEMIKHSLGAINDPSLRNDVYTQIMSQADKMISSHRFPGMKLVQLTPGLREVNVARDSLEFASTGLKEPVYDKNTMTAEVYLPNTELNRMRDIFGKDLTPAQLAERIPLRFAWRVPSTGINSAIRIKVKGFYPSKVNAVIGPADVHMIMGSDFDVDSLFVINPNYLDKNQRGKNKKVREAVESKLKEIYGGDYDQGAIGFNIKKKEAGWELTPIAEFDQKIRGLYDSSKGLDRLAYRAIYTAYLDNNMLQQYVDLMGKKENTEDATHTINFKAAKSVIDENALFNQRAFVLDPAFEKEWKETEKNGDFLNSSKVKAMENKRDNILARRSRVNTVNGYMTIQHENMGGATSIAILAKNTQTIAYSMYSVPKGETISVKKDLQVNYDGERKTIGRYNAKKGVHEITIGNSNRSIFPLLQWMTNAALDAAKEGILHVMNYSASTANAWAAGLLLGMDESTMQTFMNQPAILEISDNSSLKDNTIYVMQRELLTLMKLQKKDLTDREKVKDEYSFWDDKKKTDPEGFKSYIGGQTEKVELTHATSRNYESFQSVRDAKANMTADEFNDFAKYQLAIFETFRKLKSIGEGFFKMQKAMNIIQGPQVTYPEFQDYLDNLYQIFESKPVKEVIPNPIDASEAGETKPQTVVTYHRKLIDEQGKPINDITDTTRAQVKEGFPIQGVNLFNLAHFRSALKAYNDVHERLRSVLLAHHPAIENMAIMISDQFGIRLDPRNTNVSIDRIKNHILNSMLGLVYFTNADGKSMAINAADEPPYRRKDKKGKERGRTYQGAQAFMQRFIDRVADIKGMTKYKDNDFIKRLQIETSKGGLKKLSIQKLTGVDPEFIQGLMHVFEKLDQDERSKLNLTDEQIRQAGGSKQWYSQLQLDFLKYAILDYQLAYGATNYSQLLPADMKSQIMNKLFRLVTAVIAEQRPGDRTVRIEGDEQGKKEEASNIALVHNLYQVIGLTAAFNNPRTLPQIRWKDQRQKLQYEDEDEDAAMEAAEAEDPTKNKRPPTKLSYDHAQEVFFNFKLRTDNQTRPINDIYPLLVKDYNHTTGTTNVYVRVSKYDSGDGFYQSWYSKIGSMENMRSILAGKDAFLLGYNIQEMFPADKPRFFKLDLLNKTAAEPLRDEEHLQVEIELDPKQKLLVTEDGDFTMEKAKVYIVEGVVKEADQAKLDEVNEKLDKIQQNEQLSMSKKDKLKAPLYNERRTYYPVYRIRNTSGDMKGIRAIRWDSQKLTGTDIIKEHEQARKVIDELMSENAHQLDLMMKVREKTDTDPIYLTTEELEALSRKIDNDQVKKCK